MEKWSDSYLSFNYIIRLKTHYQRILVLLRYLVQSNPILNPFPLREKCESLSLQNAIFSRLFHNFQDCINHICPLRWKTECQFPNTHSKLACIAGIENTILIQFRGLCLFALWLPQQQRRANIIPLYKSMPPSCLQYCVR